MSMIKFLILALCATLFKTNLNASQHDYRRKNKFVEQNIKTGFYLSPVSYVKKKVTNNTEHLYLINKLKSEISRLYENNIYLKQNYLKLQDENLNLKNKLERYKEEYIEYFGNTTESFEKNYKLKYPFEANNIIQNNINPLENCDCNFNKTKSSIENYKSISIEIYYNLMQSKKNIEKENKQLHKTIELQDKIIKNPSNTIGNYNMKDIYNLIEKNNQLKQENKILQQQLSKQQIFSKKQKKRK